MKSPLRLLRRAFKSPVRSRSSVSTSAGRPLFGGPGQSHDGAPCGDCGELRLSINRWRISDTLVLTRGVFLPRSFVLPISSLMVRSLSQKYRNLFWQSQLVGSLVLFSREAIVCSYSTVVRTRIIQNKLWKTKVLAFTLVFALVSSAIQWQHTLLAGL